MNKYFKILETNERVEILDYILEKLKIESSLKIYVGTDSQNYGGFTHYATCVVLRYNKRGANVLYQTLKVPRIRDHWTRLWKEADLSLELALGLREISPIHIEAIELDYNTTKITESYKLVSAAKGYCESMGFKVLLKPEELIAVKAADRQCRL